METKMEMENKMEMQRKDMNNRMDILSDAARQRVDDARELGIDRGRGFLASDTGLWTMVGHTFDYVWTDPVMYPETIFFSFYGAEIKILEDRLIFDVYRVMYQQYETYGVFYDRSIEPVLTTVTRLTLELIDFVPRWSSSVFDGKDWSKKSSCSGWHLEKLMRHDLGLNPRILWLDAKNSASMALSIEGQRAIDSADPETRRFLRHQQFAREQANLGIGTLAQAISSWVVSRGFTPDAIIPIMRYLSHDLKDAWWEYNIRAMLSAGESYSVSGLVDLLGDAKGTKEVLNRQYDPSGQRFLTKGAFGGIGEIRDLNELKVAAILVRALRGFKPHYFEAIPKEMLATDIRDLEGYKDAIQGIVDFFGYKDKTFKAIMDVLSSNKFGNEGGYNRLLAVINELSYNRDNPLVPQLAKAVRDKFHGEPDLKVILPFMEMEVGKLYVENQEIVWEWYDLVEGAEISDQIKVVTPYFTHDLIEWGSQQNNCIGGSSHIEPVLNGEQYIIGFQKPDGTWWGHAQIDSVGFETDGTEKLLLIQLVGHSNNPLPNEIYNQIVNFLKGFGVINTRM